MPSMNSLCIARKKMMIGTTIIAAPAIIIPRSVRITLFIDRKLSIIVKPDVLC
ncbi:hypothetical protein D3C71_2203290 [compost metagenome]